MTGCAAQITAQWTVVNDSPDPAYVSIAFGQQDGTYVSQGWWELQPCGGSAVVHGGRLAVSGAFVYAHTGKGDFWGGDNLFCVADGKPFSLIRQGNCEKRGLRTVGFRLENIRGGSHTTHLTGSAKSTRHCID
ncbi:MAG TPA: DUF1036 domain-containing protein [Bryobacteraceae bacterium]